MADYAITSVTRRVVYSGSAGVGPYSFNFPVLTASDLAVYKDTTLLTLTTDYTVSIGAAGTGSVTLVVAATGSNNITIVGARTIERSSDFVTAGDLLASSLNTELDSQTIFVQQVAEDTLRGIKAPVTDPTSIDMTLPAKATRLGKILTFDDTTGNPLAQEVLGQWRGNWAASTAYNKRDIIKDTSNNNIYLANTAHTSSGSQPISSNADVAKWDLLVDAASAAASATSASGFADEAEAWAKKTDGEAQTGEGYSAKAWAVGGTGVTDTAAAGAAKEWATETTGTVDTSGYSAKEYAQGTQAGAGGSAKEWAQRAEDSAVPGGGGEYSAKHYSAKASASASSASTSASNASTSASAASTSASNASTSASAASSSAASAAASYDSFDDRYLGAKSSAPALDNDGDALITGALYFDTTASEMKVYSGSGWVATGSTISSVYQRFEYTASGGETSVTGGDDNANTLAYDAGFIMVFLNGVMLNDGDYTATSGSSITGLAALTAGDKLEVIAHGAAAPGDYYSKAASDAKYALLGANTDITSLGTISTIDLNGGTIDGAVIGGSSAAAGSFTTLSASSPISAADGSNSAPAITNTGDTDTGLYFSADNEISTATAGEQRIILDSSGVLKPREASTYGGAGAVIQGAVVFACKMPYVSSVADNTWAQISMSTPVYENKAIVDGTTTGNAITIKKAGKYMMVWNGTLGGGNSYGNGTYYVRTYVEKNSVSLGGGTRLFAQGASDNGSPSDVGLTQYASSARGGVVSGIDSLSVSDVIRFWQLHDHTGGGWADPGNVMLIYFDE